LLISIKINLSEQESLKDIFEYQPEQGITLVEMTYSINGEEAILTPGMIHEDISDGSPQQIRQLIGGLRELIKNNITDNLALKVRWIITRNRCFFEYDVLTFDSSEAEESKVKIYSPGDKFQTHIRKIIHVPGLRGNPERTYKRTSVGSEFPGTFENYVATVINHWQRNNDNRIQELNEALEKLGLTSIIEAKQLNDTQFEIKVSRLRCNSYNKDDMVSIADVGFGISQTLPILVALILAEPEQLVYLEQPEIHLHPRAQVAMAERLANTASRGVRVVVETHSDRLLLAIQSLVAEGKLSPELVKLHWFTRQEDGTTKISSANLDETGAFGDWTEDFADVSLNLENRLVIDASVARSSGDQGATYPTSVNCRDFLLAVLNICHQLVMTQDIKAEWDKHQS
jgi:hypothetical protein